MRIISAFESVIFQRNSFEFSSDSESAISSLKSPSVVIRINVYVSHQRGLAEIPLFCFIRAITECEIVWVTELPVCLCVSLKSTRSRLVKLAPTSDSGDALVSRQAIGVSKRPGCFVYLPSYLPPEHRRWSGLRGVAAGEEQETQWWNKAISKCEINDKTLRVRYRKLASNKPVDRSDFRFSNRFATETGPRADRQTYQLSIYLSVALHYSM